MGNFFSLSLLQTANYIFPLITLPYLVRILGVEKFGLVAFAQAFIQYFIVLTDYGFQLSATREVSVNRNDKKKLSEIFSSVTVIKLLFMLLSFVILCLVVFFIPKFRQDWIIYLFAFGMVFDSVLFPVWLFQGMEEMHYITARNITAKFIFTLAIFVFIRNQNDYIYVPLINSLGFIVAGLISLRLVFTQFKITFVFPSPAQISSQLKDGWHIFISKIAINLYTTTTTFVLGLVTNNTVVGYYAAGEKIVRTVITMFNPVFQAAYPHFAKSAAESKELTVKKLKKILKLTSIVSLPLFLVFFFFATPIVRILLGANFANSVLVVRILSPLLFIIPAAYIFANLGLLPFKLDKYFARIYIGGALINLFLLICLLSIFNLEAKGAAISSLITEIFLTVILFLIVNNKTKNG